MWTPFFQQHPPLVILPLILSLAVLDVSIPSMQSFATTMENSRVSKAYALEKNWTMLPSYLKSKEKVELLRKDSLWQVAEMSFVCK